jgi:ATP-dependent protease ClpP protease subunit
MMMLFSLVALLTLSIQARAQAQAPQAPQPQEPVSKTDEKTSLDSVNIANQANPANQAASGNQADVAVSGNQGNQGSQPFQFPVFDIVELTENNHVVLKGEINEESISQAIVDISNLGDNDEVVLFICSPGGSVLAGNNFIQFMNFLRQKGKTFTCVADQAASMAFGIFQACDNRYVTPSSILMQHQMSVGLQDQYENLKNRITLLDAINMQAIVTQARRIGLTVEEFKKKVVSDWWLYGEDGVCQNAADKVVQVGCSLHLLEETVEETIEFFGTTFKVVFSKCPLARAPLSFSEAKGFSDNINGHTDVDIQKAFSEYLQTRFITNTTVRYFL